MNGHDLRKQRTESQYDHLITGNVEHVALSCEAEVKYFVRNLRELVSRRGWPKRVECRILGNQVLVRVTDKERNS